MVSHGVPERGDGVVVPAVQRGRSLPEEPGQPHPAGHVRPALCQQVGRSGW